jgi:protein-tyrosine phosphatase
MTLDASNIVRRLWVGSQPPFDRDLPDFDVLVLCAQEIQPEQLAFANKVLRCPIPDSVLSGHELRLALMTARLVAKQLTAGKRVLVTCRAGQNRSAFVASLALGLVSRMTPIEIIELMRERRGVSTLGNPHFCILLHRFVGARNG